MLMASCTLYTPQNNWQVSVANDKLKGVNWPKHICLDEESFDWKQLSKPKRKRNELNKLKSMNQF